MNKLENKVAIITGAASGIGLAAAQLFAAEGATVVLADKNVEDGKTAAAKINQNKNNALFIETDITLEAAAQNLIHETIKRFDGLDILYNNAGHEEYFKLHELSNDSWTRQIDTNLRGSFLTSKFALRHFMGKKQGVILNTSSIAGFMPTQDRPAYNAAKGGVIMLTKNIALEYGQYNVRANVICPGIVRTNMTAAGMDSDRKGGFKKASVFNRAGKAEEIAQAALFLVSDDASFVTGTSLQVDGGMNLGGFWL